jgi:ATP-dependent 26S proteasome regulatory subunit
VELTAWETTAQSFLRARQPGILVNSVEEPRVMASIIRTLQWMAEKGLGVRRLTRWSSVSTQVIDILKPNEPPQTPDRSPLFGMLQAFVSPEPRPDEQVDDKTGKVIRREVLVLADIEAELREPITVRTLREVLWKIRGTTQSIFIIGQPFQVPAEIAPELALLPFELPTAKDLEKSLTPVVAAYKAAKVYKSLNIDDTVIPALARATAGLTETEARGILGLAIARHEALDNRAVDLALKEKAAIVRRSSVLEYRTCTGSLSDVGGLEHLKKWIGEQDAILSDADEAASYGLKMPSGVLLSGIPGTGKSLTAQVLAAHWKLPLLVFDVAKAFGSLVGQSESNVDGVIALANACRPCIVFMDEIEKALGGSGGEQDGGTSARVTGKLLTWLSDKQEGIFVVATANDVTAFEKRPELIRAGRFDAVFFCDLPDLRSRLEIMAIHYRKAVQRAKAMGKCALDDQIDPSAIMEAGKASRGYSGAELECAMQSALRAAFNHKPRLTCPTGALLVQAVKSQKPLSLTMKESVNFLRKWCADGRAIPAGATLEDEKKDAQALEDLGLPDILAESKI